MANYKYIVVDENNIYDSPYEVSSSLGKEITPNLDKLGNDNHYEVIKYLTGEFNPSGEWKEPYKKEGKLIYRIEI